MNKRFIKTILTALLAVCMMATSANTLVVSAAMSKIDLVYTNPGEDSSTEMRVSWHSSSSSCVLTYTTASDTGFSNAKTVSATRTSTPTAFNGNTSYYKYEATISGLNPGTEYIYKITAGSTASEVHSFKTAEKDNNFNFMWMGDVHANSSETAKITNVNKLLEYAESNTKSTGGIDFVLFSGDSVKYGERYSDWQQWNNSDATLNYMYAMNCGNKEYYDIDGARTSNKWYSAAQNNPNNGVDGLDSTYWFIYNNVLFIALDNLVSEGSEMSSSLKSTSLQQDWFEDVVTSQEGNYQYIVVFQHYPYFKSSGVCSYGGYTKWYSLFDEYGVDFALSGDSHAYVRSRALKNDKESSGGTIYITGPQISTSLSSPSITSGSGYIKAYDKNSTSNGACYFEVTDEDITMNYIAKGTTVVDTVTVKAKRAAVGGGSSSTDKPSTDTEKPSTGNEGSTNTEGYVLYQNFDTMPVVSSTKGDSTNGAWSTAVSSSTGNHVAFSQYTSSSGATSLKLKVTDGRYTIGAYCGFEGATEDSKLSFRVWIPEGSTVSRINSISIDGNEILGQTALTAGAWNTIETNAFGSNTSGAVYMEFYSSTAAAGQSFYIDDFAISGGNAETPALDCAVYEQFEDGVPTSATAKDTENGVWSSAYSSSLAMNHVSFGHSSSGYDGTNAMKLNVGDGRYTIDFYMGFEDADADDTLTFMTYVPSGSTVTSIKSITVNGTEIMGEMTLTQGEWMEIDAGAIGATDGYISFEYYSSTDCVGQYFYIDNVIVGGGSQ